MAQVRFYRQMHTPEVINMNAKSVSEAFVEGQRYLEGQGAVNNTLAELAAKLKRHGIDYVVIGGLAVREHGCRRVTDNIDLVLTVEGLTKFDRELLGRGGFGGLGYDRVIPTSSKRLRSYPGGVSIQVMTTGEYPGDCKPKPVSFPEPSSASTEIDGIQFVTLEKLIELKLASGMTAPHRLKDLADVQELIKIKGLSTDFADRLNPYVRDEFVRLSESVRNSANLIEEQ